MVLIGIRHFNSKEIRRFSLLYNIYYFTFRVNPVSKSTVLYTSLFFTLIVVLQRHIEK